MGALMAHMHEYLVLRIRGGGVGGGENMEIGEGQRLDERAALFKFGIGFTGESSHHVGADSGVGHQAAGLEDTAGIVARAILAMHAAQDTIAAGLQRRMHVLGNTRGFGHGPSRSSEKSMGSTELSRTR